MNKNNPKINSSLGETNRFDFCIVSHFQGTQLKWKNYCVSFYLSIKWKRSCNFKKIWIMKIIVIGILSSSFYRVFLHLHIKIGFLCITFKQFCLCTIWKHQGGQLADGARVGHGCSRKPLLPPPNTEQALQLSKPICGARILRGVPLTTCVAPHFKKGYAGGWVG